MKTINIWDNHFHQVSWGLDKKCGFFTNGQFLNVCGFFCSDFTFLPHEIFLNMKKPRMLLMKTVLLVWYCNAKIIFKTIKLIFAPKKWLWKLQMANFWLPLIKLPYKIWNNPSRKLFWMQNVLNFICHIMKFNNCHHTTLHFNYNYFFFILRLWQLQHGTRITTSWLPHGKSQNEFH